MSNITEKRINNCEPLKKCFWSLITVVFICLFSYGYCVRGVIVNIVQRQNVEKEISLLNNKIVDLESEYIRAKSGITPELASELGFISISNTRFVVKNINPSGLSLITNGN